MPGLTGHVTTVVASHLHCRVRHLVKAFARWSLVAHRKKEWTSYWQKSQIKTFRHTLPFTIYVVFLSNTTELQTLGINSRRNEEGLKILAPPLQGKWNWCHAQSSTSSYSPHSWGILLTTAVTSSSCVVQPPKKTKSVSKTLYFQKEEAAPF